MQTVQEIGLDVGKRFFVMLSRHFANTRCCCSSLVRRTNPRGTGSGAHARCTVDRMFKLRTQYSPGKLTERKLKQGTSYRKRREFIISVHHFRSISVGIPLWKRPFSPRGDVVESTFVRRFVIWCLRNPLMSSLGARENTSHHHTPPNLRNSLYHALALRGEPITLIRTSVQATRQRCTCPSGSHFRMVRTTAKSPHCTATRIGLRLPPTTDSASNASSRSSDDIPARNFSRPRLSPARTNCIIDVDAACRNEFREALLRPCR